VFTLVVSLVVIAASVAAVLRLVLAEPGQPATDGPRVVRGRAKSSGAPRVSRSARHARSKEAARARDAAVAMASATGTSAVDLDHMGVLRRIRSGLALLLLLALVGTVLAGAIGALLFIAGLALRNAVN
jgi:hypothetical protein